MSVSYTHLDVYKRQGIYILDCPAFADEIEYTFDFGDLKISVPLTSLILSPEAEGGYCGFAVQPTNDSMVLGDVFLSSAYVVFDLDNYKISLAQANWDVSEITTKLVNVRADGSIPGGKTATAEPWTANEPFTVTSNIFSSTDCKSTPIIQSSTTPSSIANTSMLAGKYSTKILGTRLTTTLSKTTPSSMNQSMSATTKNSNSGTLKSSLTVEKSGSSFLSTISIETSSMSDKETHLTHSKHQTIRNSHTIENSRFHPESVHKTTNRPAHKTIITETVTKYSTVLVNICKPTY